MDLFGIMGRWARWREKRKIILFFRQRFGFRPLSCPGKINEAEQRFVDRFLALRAIELQRAYDEQLEGLLLASPFRFVLLESFPITTRAYAQSGLSSLTSCREERFDKCCQSAKSIGFAVKEDYGGYLPSLATKA